MGLPEDPVQAKLVIDTLNLSSQYGVVVHDKKEFIEVLCYDEDDKAALEDLIKNAFPTLGFHTFTNQSNRQFRIVAKPVPLWLSDEDIQEACVEEGLPKPIMIKRLTYRSTETDERGNSSTSMKPSQSVLIGFPKKHSRGDVIKGRCG